MRFSPGETVRVLDLKRLGHVRTPAYLRGRTGRVARLLGPFRDPENLAYGGDGLPEKPLYRVAFEQRELWPDYADAPGDTLYADIYEDWLEGA